jgi:hypothetical protein
MLIGFGAVCSGCPVPTLCGRINRANLSVWVLPGLFPHRGNAHPVRFKTGIIICSGDMVLVVVFGEVTKLAVATALLLHKSG